MRAMPLASSVVMGGFGGEVEHDSASAVAALAGILGLLGLIQGKCWGGRYFELAFVDELCQCL